ncbi:MAG: SelB C-terminal domain-containing protein, partial [Novosphingobium sp.]
VEIVGLLGIARAIVAVTKCDLVEPEVAEAVAGDAVKLLASNGLKPLPFRGGVGGGVWPARALFTDRPHPNPSPEEEGLMGAILTSTVTGQGMAELRQTLVATAHQQLPRTADGTAWLPIDRAFAVPGYGPVVTGTLRGASLSLGHALELLPSRRKVRVRGMQVHGAAVVSAQPGQRVAVNLRGVELGQLARGIAMAAAGTLEAADWLTITLRSVPEAPALRNGARLRALFGTQEAEARLRLLDRDVLEPGDACFAQLRLASPAAVPAREPIVLRRASPALTLAGGRVLEPEARRLRRHDGTVLDWLELLRDGSPAEVIAAAVARGGEAGTTVRHLARLTALSALHVEELLGALPVELGRAGAVLPRDVAKKRKRLALRHDPDPDRARADAERAVEISELLRHAGLMPPLPKQLIVDASAHRAVERLLREGTVIRAVDHDKGKELLFHRDAIAAARQVLAPILADGLRVSEIAAALGISRKFCMPLLDHLDTIRFTRREGERRFAGPAAPWTVDH